jgi:hypothetical protein
MISEPIYLAWELGLCLAVAGVMMWKYRRTERERRINRGLRTYITG